MRERWAGWAGREVGGAHAVLLAVQQQWASCPADYSPPPLPAPRMQLSLMSDFLRSERFKRYDQVPDPYYGAC